MSYCPECGEKVAKDDVFCPFCGISLKPVSAVEDSSLSETVFGMPPVPVGNEIPADLTAKAGADTPKIETQNPPVIERPEPAEPITKPGNLPGFSAGDTSENWTMKTDSVDIPAEQLEDVKSIPLPSVFGDAEAAAEPEKTPEFIVPPPPPVDDGEPEFALAPEEPENASTIEKPEIIETIGEVPTPAIIQEPNLELKTEESFNEPEVSEPAVVEPDVSAEIEEVIETAPIESEFPKSKVEEPQSFEPPVSAPVSESVDFFDARTESPEFAEPVATVSDIPENVDVFEEKSDAGSSAIPTELEEQKLADDVFQPVSEEPPFVPEISPEKPEIPVEAVPSEPVAEKIAKQFTPPFAQISAESEKIDTIQPEAPAAIPEPPVETPEPPILMPDLPPVSEVQDVPAKFDSVKIIRSDEIEEEKAKAAPVAVSPEESKEGRPFTTPNIGHSDTDGRKAAKLKPLDEGTILNNRYEIVRKIGGGGMGAVYLANDRNLGGVLRAVKEMVQSYIESEQQDKAVNDFKRESLLLTSLDHPAIPTIYDYFFDEKEGRFYLVMKYISGGDLAGRLRAAPEGRIDEKSVTEWAIQIADVLDYLHNHEPSIVYRDLKPANVMIDGNSGRVMLIDFGIARWVNKEEKGVTAVGTMGYAPPELFSGNVEPRSDIYSLGSTMFHLLTGADPQSNPLLIFDFQKNPRPRQINSQLSDQIEQILLRAVEYNADARFSSAAEMRDALKEHFNNLQMGKVTYGVKVAPSNRAFSEQAVFCGFCGKQIVATDVFCAFCGAQQPIAQPGVSHSSIAVQPLTAKLMILGTGELEPSSFRLEKTENLLGRRDPMSNIFPEVDLSKYDPQTKISRRHARIWREGNSFLVEDLGSSNGTTLLPSASDSVRLLPHQPHTLTNGDKIKLGDTTLHFTIG